jgi:dihydrolipoamide dehydrogenase
VVLATGSSATIPPVPGLAEAHPWTNIEATTAKRVPRRLFVLGGGVVGVEMAQAWSSLGSDVTLVHRDDRLIEREERFAGAQVEAGLRAAGVDVRLQTSVTAVARNGAVRIELDDGTTSEADEILVAIGRTPRTTDVGVETVGLEPGSTCGRRVAARPGARLALRRRRQRPGAPDAHGEVPGASPPTRSSGRRCGCARTAARRRA